MARATFRGSATNGMRKAVPADERTRSPKRLAVLLEAHTDAMKPKPEQSKDETP